MNALKKTLPILFFFCISWIVKAQEIWDFPSSQINQGDYKITDTIYMSPNGNDSQLGSIDQPVATFNKALELLPFGTSGVKGGNAYGLIRLLEGTYELESGFQQPFGQYKKGNTYKHVSIEGVGEVFLKGKGNELIEGHIIRMLGSHVFVRNLHVSHGAIHGVFVNADHLIQDVLIDNVVVDSVSSFSMLATNVHNIRVRNSKFLRGSRIKNDSLLPGPECQWPSGLKFLECKYIEAYNNEVAYTRGEGLNFHNSQYGIAYGNKLYDNPTNLYCDNSARIIIRNNLIYSTPGNETYWKTCPADPVDPDGSTGILLANEGSCGAQSVFYGNCNTNCPFSGKVFPQIDSIFIWNNFLINNGKALSIWQGNTSPLGGTNCVRNVFFEHNTVAGLVGKDKSSPIAPIYSYFASVYNTITGLGYATAENIQVRANLFLMPEEYTNVDLVNIKLHNTFPVPYDITFEENLTNLDDPRLGDSKSVVENTSFMTTTHEDSLDYYFKPCSDNALLIKKVELNDRTPYDYYYDMRTSFSANAGAVNYWEFCSLGYEIHSDKAENPFIVFPNPGTDRINIEYLPHVDMEHLVKIFDVNGRLLGSYTFHNAKEVIDISHLSSGMYFIQIRSKLNKEVLKFIKR